MSVAIRPVIIVPQVIRTSDREARATKACEWTWTRISISRSLTSTHSPPSSPQYPNSRVRFFTRWIGILVDHRTRYRPSEARPIRSIGEEWTLLWSLQLFACLRCSCGVQKFMISGLHSSLAYENVRNSIGLHLCDSRRITVSTYHSTLYKERFSRS